MRTSALLVGVVAALLAASCSPTARARATAQEDAVAAAVNDSLSVALDDSLLAAVGMGPRAHTTFAGTLDACTDVADARGWYTVSSPHLDAELPADFTSTSSSSWRARDGSYVAFMQSGTIYPNPNSTECETVVFGGKVRLQLTKESYGYEVRAEYTGTNGETAFANGGSRLPERVADILHALRGARISRGA